MREISKAELLREPLLDEEGLRDTHPLDNFQYYVKYRDEHGNYVLRFDNGYGALVNLQKETVTAISWRPEAKHVTEYYDVTDSIDVKSVFGYLEIIRDWKTVPPPF